MTAEKALAAIVDQRNQTDRHLQQICGQLEDAAILRIIAALIEAITLQFAQTIAPNASGVSDPTAITDIYPPPGMAGTPGYPAG